MLQYILGTSREQMSIFFDILGDQGRQDEWKKELRNANKLISQFSNKRQSKLDFITWEKSNKTCAPSMIHSARPTILTIVITILTWKLFCFARFYKVGTDRRKNGRTDTTCEIVITTGRDCDSASWIKNCDTDEKVHCLGFLKVLAFCRFQRWTGNGGCDEAGYFPHPVIGPGSIGQLRRRRLR